MIVCECRYKALKLLSYLVISVGLLSLVVMACSHHQNVVVLRRDAVDVVRRICTVVLDHTHVRRGVRCPASACEQDLVGGWLFVPYQILVDNGVIGLLSCKSTL